MIKTELDQTLKAVLRPLGSHSWKMGEWKGGRDGEKGNMIAI